MSAQANPIGMTFSPAAEKRYKMFAASLSRLQHFAYRALFVREMRNDEVVAVCIQVDSPHREIVDLLMPDHNWQEYRDRGEEPVARGTAMFSICEVVAEDFPDLKEVLLERPPEGKMKCIVLDEGGCSVYDIDPVEQLL